jgi:hypothetical protein
MILENYFNGNFQLNTGSLSRQLSLVNLFVKEAPELVMNLEDTPHHVKGNLPEQRFFKPDEWGADMNWHNSLPVFLVY